MWKPIPGFPAYEVSEMGKVRSLRYQPPRIVGQRLNGIGYLRVALYRGKGPEDKHVHRIMAEVFHGEPKPGEEVRHLNGVKTDNRADNLAWGTRKENVGDMMQAKSHYLQKPLKHYRCDECELTSTAPGVASHQRSSGHRGRTLEEENTDGTIL